MTGSGKVVLQELVLIREDLNRLAREVVSIAQRMKALERSQATMDTILRTSSSEN